MQLAHLLSRSTIHLTGVVVAKAITMWAFILLARRLGPDQLGLIILFSTLSMVVTNLMHGGLLQWYQVNLHKLDADVVLNKLLLTRLFLALAAGFIIAPILTWFYSFEIWFGLLLGITFICEALAGSMEVVYLARKQSGRVSLAQPLRVLPLLLGLIFISSITLQTGLLLYVFGLALAAAFLSWPILRTLNWQAYSFAESLQTLKSARHYAVLGITSLTYARGDHLLVEMLKGTAQLGIYGAVYRYIDALALVPTVISQNLFHQTANFKDEDKTHFMYLWLLVSGLGLGAAIALVLASSWLTVGLLGPSFAAAQPVLLILAVATWLIFANAPLATLVQSSPQAAKFVPWGVANTILNLALNIVLISWFGIVGAALTMVITEATGLGIHLAFSTRIFRQSTHG